MPILPHLPPPKEPAESRMLPSLFFGRQILEENGVDPSKRPFSLTRNGFDSVLLAVLRVQRATESELKIAAESPWGEPLSARVSHALSGAFRYIRRRFPPEAILKLREHLFFNTSCGFASANEHDTQII